MIEPTDEIQRAYAEAWFRTIGMDEEDVQRMVAIELADPMPWRLAALAAVLALVERDLSAGWLIWSNEHQMWWKSNSAGYTADMMCAGRYSLEAALAATGPLKTEAGLPRDVVVRAPSVALIGNRDLAGKMREAVQYATRAAMP